MFNHMTTEIWKIVEDFKGYEVSNMGNLRIIHNKRILYS